MQSRTHVDEHRFIFTSEVEHDEQRSFVTVHWAGLAFPVEDSFIRPLRAYLRPRHEVGEVWMLYPQDLDPLHVGLQDLERFPAASAGGTPRLYRFFTVDADGTFQEQRSVASRDEVPVTASTMTTVIEDGLRQMFRDTEALASATAGFHFTHPSGAHSAHFIRASQAVSRTQHNFFAAIALLGQIRAGKGATVWVDTAGIATVGYALAELYRRLGGPEALRVESFTGYGGLRGSLNPSQGDIALISGSTSGSLARAVIAKKRMSAASVSTLFYLGARVPDPADGYILCDLTNRDLDVVPSVRDARVAPYKTAKANKCKLCASGSAEILLDGDSFFPAARALDLRMPNLGDRPYAGMRKRPEGTPVTHFDGQDYFEDLFGLGAIAYTAGTAVEGSAHGVSTRLSHLLGEDSPARPAQRVEEALRRAITAAPPVTVVISLPDPDSVSIGRFAARHLFSSTPTEVAVPSDVKWRVWREDGGIGLTNLTPECTVLVCAGVVGSGRQLTAISRELRKVGGGFQPLYFVGAAHPESSTTWSILENTLGRVSDTQTSRLTPVWVLPREPRSPQSTTPWTREEEQLRLVAQWLGKHASYAPTVGLLETRIQQLNALTDSALFVGSRSAGTDVGMPDINPSFALWPFPWESHDQSSEGAVPTHAEIYATVAHLLYQSRRLSPTVEKRTITTRRHGYALHPAIFDRFNDPVIQSAVLRAAEPGELHYDQDADASRAVADLLNFVLSNVTTEAGKAAYEFLLAVAQGRDSSTAHGLRINDAATAMVLDNAQKIYGDDFGHLYDIAPRVRVLLLYLREAQA